MRSLMVWGACAAPGVLLCAECSSEHALKVELRNRRNTVEVTGCVNAVKRGVDLRVGELYVFYWHSDAGALLELRHACAPSPAERRFVAIPQRIT